MGARILIITLFTILIGLNSTVYAQAIDEKKDDGHVPGNFRAQTKEASFVCGPFLPNQIAGITELMALCGGRFGIKINQKTFMETMILSGSGRGQRYLMGSASFRADVAYEDIIASAYLGADIHYPTAPIYDSAGLATGETTSIYFGGHVGGAMWAQLGDSTYFRTDMKFNLSPGTSLFIGFSLVLRFDPGSDQENAGPNQR